MTPFEFLSLAISVIFGLALTRLISGIGIAIRQIKSNNYDGLHGIWMVNMLILLPGYWWSLFAWSKFEDWNILYFGLLLLYTIILYLITDFLVPYKFDSTQQAREYFAENKKLFLVLVLASLAIDFVETQSLARLNLRPVPHGQVAAATILALILIINLFTKKKKLDYLYGVIWGLVLLAYLFYGIFFIR